MSLTSIYLFSFVFHCTCVNVNQYLLNCCYAAIDYNPSSSKRGLLILVASLPELVAAEPGRKVILCGIHCDFEKDLHHFLFGCW